MKQSILSLTTLLLTCLCFATVCAGKQQPDDHLISRMVSVPTFHAIETGMGIPVTYTPGQGSPIVVVKATPELIDSIRVEVSANGILRVGLKPRKTGYSWSEPNKKVEIEVTAPGVHTFKASNGGSIRMTEPVKTQGTLTLSTKSGGSVKAASLTCDEAHVTSNSGGSCEAEALTCNQLNVSANSGGNSRIGNIQGKQIQCTVMSAGKSDLSGQCDQCLYSATSAGKIEACELQAKEVNATASSAGDVNCYVSEVLTASTSSGGKVLYKGNPKKVNHINSGLYHIE